MHPETNLTPILGVYNVRIGEGNEVVSMYFTLQRNVVDFDFSFKAPEDRLLRFSFKGAAEGRQLLSMPRALLNLDVDPALEQTTFLDLDFFKSFRRLDVSGQQAHRVLEQLQTDVAFLQEARATDYSLLVCMVIRPYSKVLFQREDGTHSNIANRASRSVGVEYELERSPLQTIREQDQEKESALEKTEQRSLREEEKKESHFMVAEESAFKDFMDKSEYAPPPAVGLPEAVSLSGGDAAFDKKRLSMDVGSAGVGSRAGLRVLRVRTANVLNAKAVRRSAMFDGNILILSEEMD